ncbi:MAG: hypothetical protein ACOY82_17530 [Pseudomonadota bacterium]
MNVRSHSVRLSFPIVLLAMAALPGCKTTESAYVPAARPVAPATQYQPRIEEDRAYVAYVESVARRRGVSVRWVHKPVKRHVDQE